MGSSKTVTVLTAFKITELTTKFPGLGVDTFVHERDYNQAENGRVARQQQIERLQRDLTEAQRRYSDLCQRWTRLPFETAAPLACTGCGAMHRAPCCPERQLIPASELIRKLWMLAYRLPGEKDEVQRLREGLALIASDEHRLMNVTARQTAQSILDGKPIGTAEKTAACDCQHDLLKPGTTIEVIDQWKARCKNCFNFFDLPGRPAEKADEQCAHGIPRRFCTAAHGEPQFPPPGLV